jgi:hypothetical protein
MNNFKIIFNKLDWDSLNVGMRQKVHVSGNSKLRLIEFNDQFEEKDWCKNGHLGYVLEGEMSIRIRQTVINYSKGDVLDISAGAENKHKVIIKKGGHVQLIVFEKNPP